MRRALSRPPAGPPKPTTATPGRRFPGRSKARPRRPRHGPVRQLPLRGGRRRPDRPDPGPHYRPSTSNRSRPSLRGANTSLSGHPADESCRSPRRPGGGVHDAPRAELARVRATIVRPVLARRYPGRSGPACKWRSDREGTRLMVESRGTITDPVCCPGRSRRGQACGKRRRDAAGTEDPRCLSRVSDEFDPRRTSQADGESGWNA